MKKLLYLTAGVSVLVGAGVASAQFSDHRPPPQINFSRSPRTMAEEALNESRKNRPETPTFIVNESEQDYVVEDGADVQGQVPLETEYEEVVKIPRKKKTIYDVIDKDGDGVISKGEYDAFAQERTNKIYADMDEDGDGAISREEFNRYKARGR